MNKSKNFKILSLFAVILGMIFIFLGLDSSNSHVEAAAYGRGAKFTVPKTYRGTWYSYGSRLSDKVKITAHTFNGQTVYKISSMKARDKASAYAQTHDNKKRDKMLKSVGNICGAKYVKSKGKKYIFFIPWLANIGDGYFRPTTKKINGHNHRVLICQANFSGWDISTTYYTSKTLAKQMKK